MRVKATSMVYYGNRRIHPGQTFTLVPITVNFDNDGKKLPKPQVISAEDQFTESCMVKVSNREVYKQATKKKGSHTVAIPGVVESKEIEAGFDQELEEDQIPETAPGADAENPVPRASTGDQDVI